MEFTAGDDIKKAGGRDPGAYEAERLISAIPGMDARGGASIASMNGKIIIFGGADRSQRHFNDLWVLEPGKSKWKRLHCKGDIPMKRSGHSVVGYGKYMLLFGGIDFSEEVVYNDLYALNLDSWEWSYVGEAGEEVPARNSHTSGVLRDPASGDHFLIVFGGASPEHGPLGDTYAAKLPRVEDIVDVKEMYVTWRLIKPPASGAPRKREMQAGCVCDGSLFITGGRDLEGNVLSDTWKLSFHNSEHEKPQVSREESGGSPATAAEPESAPCVVDITRNFGRFKDGDVHNEPVQAIGLLPEETGVTSVDDSTCSSLCWELCRNMQLLEPLCSHVAASTADGYMVLYGGFTGAGIADSLHYVKTETGGPWLRGPASSLGSLEPRFGACLCSRPVLTDEGSSESRGGDGGVVLFGGVNAENDFSDVWYLK